MSGESKQTTRVLSVDFDVRILVIVLTLMGIGVSLVASSSSFFSGGVFEDHFALMRRHVVRVVLALGALILATKVDYRIYRRMAPVLFVVALAAIVGLFAFGTTMRNTVRWYGLPLISATIQPAEIARFCLVLFLAYWITRAGNQIKDFRRGFLPAAIAVVLLSGAVAATPNYGTATAMILISIAMLFIGGARVLHLAAFVSSGAGLAVLKVMSGGYVRERVLAFLHPGNGTDQLNWQVHQSLIGLGSGGIFGVGLGASQQKLSWLPDSHTDFIFSILGEELGLLGTLVVSLLFLMFVLRAMKISRNASDVFGEMLAVGIGISVFVYATLNMFVTTGLFPVTGLPLPFLSYGGSALIVNAAAAGVLLNISQRRGEAVGKAKLVRS